MKIDLHIHTNHSGHSLLSPQAVAKAARRKGIERVAITDHDSICGAMETARVFPTIIGEEITCEEGDLIGLFLTEVVKPGSVPEVMDSIRSQGGLVIVPHPFDTMRSESLMSEELCAMGDVIEVFNSRVIRARDNARADAFAKERMLPRVVGSDAHTAYEVGRSCLEVDDASGPRGLMESLAKATLHMKRSPAIAHLETKLLKCLGR